MLAHVQTGRESPSAGLEKHRQGLIVPALGPLWSTGCLKAMRCEQDRISQFWFPEYVLPCGSYSFCKSNIYRMLLPCQALRLRSRALSLWAFVLFRGDRHIIEGG